MRPFIARLLREPVAHFVAAGSLLFAAQRLLFPPPPDPRVIKIDPAFVEGLRAEHRSRTGSPPTPEEDRALIARYVEEEALAREAIALGLDRGDVIVRRRLLQKMEYLLGEGAVADLGDADLQAYLSAHEARYREPVRVSFGHVFFSADRRGASLDQDAAAALVALQGGADPATLGDAYPRGRDLVGRTESDVAAELGPAFARKVMALSPGKWEGPVRSSYGLHLVRVSERREGRVPPLAEIRARVAEDARDERREEALRAARQRIVARYRIEGP